MQDPHTSTRQSLLLSGNFAFKLDCGKMQVILASKLDLSSPRETTLSR